MSKSNPEHHDLTASHTNRSQQKEKRAWEDLQSEKKAYLKRKAEEEESNRTIRNLHDYDEGEEDHPPF